MVKDQYNQDENDFETFEDFQDFYGLEEYDGDEPAELDFYKVNKQPVEDSSLDRDETNEND